MADEGSVLLKHLKTGKVLWSVKSEDFIQIQKKCIFQYQSCFPSENKKKQSQVF